MTGMTALYRRSLPAWGVWIEIMSMYQIKKEVLSLPAWGVWIEITINGADSINFIVAPRMGSVD